MMIFTIAKMDREDGPPSVSHFGNFRSDRVRVFGFPEPLRFQAIGRTHETIRQVKIARICTNPGPWRTGFRLPSQRAGHRHDASGSPSLKKLHGLAVISAQNPRRPNFSQTGSERLPPSIQLSGDNPSTHAGPTRTASGTAPPDAGSRWCQSHGRESPPCSTRRNPRGFQSRQSRSRRPFQAH